MGNSNQDWKLLCIAPGVHCTVRLIPFAERMTGMKGSGPRVPACLITDSSNLSCLKGVIYFLYGSSD